MPRKTSKAKGKELRQTKLDFFSALGFQKFPELPAELRQMIIQEALLEDEKKRPAQVVLFDHNTYRVSPLRKLSDKLSPMLFVNTEFRAAALKIYVRLQVLDLDVVNSDQYGEAEDWEDEYANVQYSLEIAKMIDIEATEGSGDRFEGPAGHVYVRPGTDSFLSGLIPRQISDCSTFCEMLNEEQPVDDTWIRPIFCITERLPQSACAKIANMGHFVWDPEANCPHCIGYHGWQCPHCFLNDRGQSLLDDPILDVDVFPTVEEFGLYIMGGKVMPETIMYKLGTAADPMKALDGLADRYVDISGYRRMLDDSTDSSE